MQPIMKVAAVVIAVALIAVVGLIYLLGQKGEPMPQATAAVATPVPEATEAPENLPSEATDDADNEAQAEKEAAQDTMYEGALAGLTEEEIAKQALAEEAMEGVEGSTDD